MVVNHVIMYPAVMQHRAPVSAFGYVQGSLLDGLKVSVLPVSVVVVERWNGKWSRIINNNDLCSSSSFLFSSLSLAWIYYVLDSIFIHINVKENNSDAFFT